MEEKGLLNMLSYRSLSEILRKLGFAALKKEKRDLNPVSKTLVPRELSPTEHPP